MKTTILFVNLHFVIGLKSFRNVTIGKPSWLANQPENFRANHKLHNALANHTDMENFRDVIAKRLTSYTGGGRDHDGEDIDSVEHYFWGMKGGLSMELGGRDGTHATSSMTYLYEYFGWHRIVIEADPKFNLTSSAPTAVGIKAAICSTESTVHFVPNGAVSGIAEFMSKLFMEHWNSKIYEAGNPKGSLENVDWVKLQEEKRVIPIDCVPLKNVLRYLNVKHVNFFILDVEVSP